MQKPDLEEVNQIPREVVFRAIESKNLFEETVSRLGQAIKLGIVPRGERFPTERDLAEELGVSRPTVREALRALEQAGFVEIRRGRNGGAYVLHDELGRSLKRARQLVREMGGELDDAVDFRRAIEPTIAALAAERRSDEQLTRTTTVLEESKQVLPAHFRGADSRFHLSLAEMSGSPSLEAAATDIQLRLSELIAAVPIMQESIRHSHAQHHKILDAIRDQDSEGARLVMIEHIDGTADLFRGLV